MATSPRYDQTALHRARRMRQPGPRQAASSPASASTVAHDLHLRRTDHTVTLQRGELRQQGFWLFPEHGGAGSDACGGADPGGGLSVGELQYPHQELGHGGRAVLPRQICRGVGDQPVINQREFVADGFEALPHRHLLIGFEAIKSAGFHGVDHIGKC